MKQIKFRIWDNAMIYDNWIALHADPKYVMQFTGVLDQNGKEIYEGDIVSGSCFHIQYKNCVIEFFNGAFVLMGYYQNVSVLEGDFRTPGLEIEIVGNSYENPELLENK